MKKSLLILLLILIVLPVFAEEKADALLLYRTGKYEEAITVCLQELETYPDDAVSRRMDSYSVLGWCYMRLGRYEDAIQSSEEALKLSRYDYRIVEILAESYFFTGESLKALEYFEQYTVLNPIGDRIKTAYYLMGEIFIQLGEYNHADIAFSTALYHEPNVANWWNRLGYAREMAEEYESAIIAYEKALELKPTLQEASEGLNRVKQQL